MKRFELFWKMKIQIIIRNHLFVYNVKKCNLLVINSIQNVNKTRRNNNLRIEPWESATVWVSKFVFSVEMWTMDALSSTELCSNDSSAEAQG